MADWHTGRWSLYAPVYDAHKGLTRGPRRRSFELLDLKPTERVLIVGCGTGLDFEFVPPGVIVEAIDASPAMAGRAGRRAASLLPAARVRVMDATRLDYPDAAFDAVVLHLILAVLPDPARCVQEVARVLRPGGRVAVLDKFVPGDCRPGRTRRALNVLTRAAATSITARLQSCSTASRSSLSVRSRPCWVASSGSLCCTAPRALSWAPRAWLACRAAATGGPCRPDSGSASLAALQGVLERQREQPRHHADDERPEEGGPKAAHVEADVQPVR